jgi:L-fuconolactonase
VLHHRDVIDAHQHFVFPDRISYPDLEQAMPEINRPLTPADLEPQIRAAKVDGTILVQAANDPAETRLMLDLASHTPWMLGVVGWVPLENAEVAATALSQVAEPGLVGIRYLIHREPDPGWLSAPTRLESLRVLAQQGLAYDLLALAKGHLENAIVIADHVPELTLVIDHLGGPYVRGNRWEPWASIMTELAQHSRCVVKYSGLDPIGGSVEGYQPYVDHLFEQFGADRIMWASNWPATRLGGPYRYLVEDSLRLLPPMAQGDRQHVFDGTARRTYDVAGSERRTAAPGD